MKTYIVFEPQFNGSAGIGDNLTMKRRDLEKFDSRKDAIDFILNMDQCKGMTISINQERTSFAFIDGNGNKYHYMIAED